MFLIICSAQTLERWDRFISREITKSYWHVASDTLLISWYSHIVSRWVILQYSAISANIAQNSCP
jgi:hypothetical protein